MYTQTHVKCTHAHSKLHTFSYYTLFKYPQPTDTQIIHLHLYRLLSPQGDELPFGPQREARCTCTLQLGPPLSPLYGKIFSLSFHSFFSLSLLLFSHSAIKMLSNHDRPISSSRPPKWHNKFRTKKKALINGTHNVSFDVGALRSHPTRHRRHKDNADTLPDGGL